MITRLRHIVHSDGFNRSMIAVILLACRVMGIIGRYLGQTQVVSEMITGVVLGPSLLGLFLPEDNLHAPNESFKLSVMDKGIATSMRILSALAQK